ncbi:hypothetical protein [Streptomyces phytohabitans]|uniref:hypothetical protein n=1 Tax=Streptomyces phytohabitans TaxID=1150371 RepID=UPI00345B4D20
MAAAAALCAVAALPGAATADPGDLPAYRTADGAKPVKGAASSSDGPRLAAGGTYTDTIQPGEKRYYSVELDRKSTPWLSAAALPEAGAEVGGAEGLSLTLLGADGTECGSEDVDFGADGAARPIAASVGRLDEPDGNCQQPGVYHLSVERVAGSGPDAPTDPAAWPLELRFMREPGLRRLESTTPPENGDLPTGAPDLPTGEARELDGGTGFNDAVGMTGGAWKDRLRPGETRWYRVPVDWGQQLVLSAEFGTARTSDETAYASDGVRVDLYGPARGHIDDAGGTYTAGEPEQVTAATYPVTYQGRYAYDGAVSHASVAGWYYVAVHAHAAVGEFTDGPVPVTLRTALRGERKAGPGYDGDPAEGGFGVTGEDREQAEKGQSADATEDGDGGALRLVGYAGIGTGTVLLAGLGAWTVLARRRAGAGAPDAGTGTGTGMGTSAGREPTGAGPGGWGPQPPRGWS